MSEEKRAQELTRQWVERAVVGLELCPFARAPLEAGLIRFGVCSQVDPERRAHFFLEELEHLQSSTPAELSTTLLIFPKGEQRFRDFLDFTASLQDLLARAGARQLFQLVPFHPDFRLAGAPVGGRENWVGRSPFPTVHLLRSEDVALALAGTREGERLSRANAAKLKALDPKARKWAYFFLEP